MGQAVACAMAGLLLLVSYIISRCLWLSPRIALRCSKDNLFRRERRAIRECRSDKHSFHVRLHLPFLGVPQRSSPWERTRAVAHTSRKERLVVPGWTRDRTIARSEEHTSELKSLTRISYA